MVQIKLSVTLILAAAAAVIAQPGPPHYDYLHVQRRVGSPHTYNEVQTAPGRMTKFLIGPHYPFIGSNSAVSRAPRSHYVYVPNDSDAHSLNRNVAVVNTFHLLGNPGQIHHVLVGHFGPFTQVSHSTHDETVNTVFSHHTNAVTEFVTPHWPPTYIRHYEVRHNDQPHWQAPHPGQHH